MPKYSDVDDHTNTQQSKLYHFWLTFCRSFCLSLCKQVQLRTSCNSIKTDHDQLFIYLCSDFSTLAALGSVRERFCH